MTRTFGVIGVGVAVLQPISVHAQNTGATLQGVVSDQQHAMLPGVTMTITNIDTGLSRSVVTDLNGWYRAAALPPGEYSLSAELAGFDAYRSRGASA